MSEPLSDLPAGQAPDISAVETAFARRAELPFFDLDIALIRRSQQVPPAVQPSVAASAPDLTRERKALDALETLLAQRAEAKPVMTPVARFPSVTPVLDLPVAKAAPHYLESRVMPVNSQATPNVGFVSPGFERVSFTTPAAGEPLIAVTAALLQTATDVSARAADILPELKLHALRAAIARRDILLAKTQRNATQAAWRPAVQPVQAPAVLPTNTAATDGDDLPEDLPWGHVTYRLMVM